MRRLMSVLLFTILSQATPSWGQVGNVIREGKEWLQPADFSLLTWFEINAVCPEGVCNGELNGIDVTGYTWASVDDVNALFNSYGVSPPMGPGPDIRLEWPSTWAPLYFEDFLPMTDNSLVFDNSGWTRSEVLNNPSDAYSASVQYSTIPEETDAFNTGSVGPKTAEALNFGAYFWRPAITPAATAIPTMPVYGLAIMVLGLLLVTQRQLHPRKASRG